MSRAFRRPKSHGGSTQTCTVIWRYSTYAATDTTAIKPPALKVRFDLSRTRSSSKPNAYRKTRKSFYIALVSARRQAFVWRASCSNTGSDHR